MGEKRKRADVRKVTPSGKAARKRRVSAYLLAFSFGAVLAGGGVLLATQEWGTTQFPSISTQFPRSRAAGMPGRRTVAELIALSDEDLERADIVEMSIAVAREIPGLEGLEYDKYQRTVDGWTEQFTRWLPTVENSFHRDPSKYHDDINFFRLGMLAQFLDQHGGIAYIEEQARAQIEARKAGRKAVVFYTDPGDVLLHGLIDTKRGTCVTMPTLHVAMGRRLRWPVALACVKAHYVCRYDDGKVVYNIEATDTGRGGFAVGTDADYIKAERIPSKAIACGSDLRKLSAREMLGVFVQARARHFQDTGKPNLAARDYALAHTLFPDSRKIYMGLVGNLLPVGERLFERSEQGHPISLAAYLGARYRGAVPGSTGAGRTRDGLGEVERINAINRANMRRLMQPPTPLHPQQYQPARPRYPNDARPQGRRR